MVFIKTAAVEKYQLTRIMRQRLNTSIRIITLQRTRVHSIQLIMLAQFSHQLLQGCVLSPLYLQLLGQLGGACCFLLVESQPFVAFVFQFVDLLNTIILIYGFTLNFTIKAMHFRNLVIAGA